ncbi:hypothetical protein M1M97_00415 [Thermodesulfovibrionales bacterium]|nr:hypothetical protein [Thermodesulfovibrionales bacterium]
MERMDMHSRNEYLKVLREKYLKARTKREKSQILDEYCGNTGQARKYVIRKIQPGVDLGLKQRKKRKETYDSQVKAALAKVWEIFDHPCGQRLKPLLEVEVDRLSELGELRVSGEVASKLNEPTIDRKLKHQREVLHLLKSKGGPKPGSLLKQKIPIRLTEWDSGEYINTLNTTEISSGWWEGEAIMGRSQEHSFWALKEIRKRTPFEWRGLDSDNGQEFVNQILYKYCQREKLEFTRSRPNRKNDNAYIEQKNWTHVRKLLGYLRYDTLGEVVINDLYRSELRLYKNFFQPVMKLVSKERIGGSLKRKYDTPKTPYQRLMDSGQISEQTRKQLKTVYLSLNPAQLKRSIDAKLDERTYEEKRKSQQVNPMRKVIPHTVTSFMIQQPKVGLPT